MLRSSLVVLVLFAILHNVECQAEAPVGWRSKSGHEVWATLDGLDLMLVRKDGQEIRVSFDLLTPTSQAQAIRLIQERMDESARFGKIMEGWFGDPPIDRKRKDVRPKTAQEEAMDAAKRAYIAALSVQKRKSISARGRAQRASSNAAIRKGYDAGAQRGSGGYPERYKGFPNSWRWK